MRPTLMLANAITKRFGGVKALTEVSLDIRQGEIYGLIGPNGAGKTTFFNVLTGLYHPDGGELLFEGRKLQASAPHIASQRGIARTFQNIRLFANMTSLENVMVGQHARTRAGVFGGVLRTAGGGLHRGGLLWAVVDMPRRDSAMCPVVPRVVRESGRVNDARPRGAA